jgi:hypothetical protein
MNIAFYLLIIFLLNFLLATMDWGCIYLSLVIVITYLLFRPTRALHPNNVLFGFFGLYIVLPSVLSFILYQISWIYMIPWAESIQWNLISRYVLFQAEFTFLVLYFGIFFFTRRQIIKGNVEQLYCDVRRDTLFLLSLSTLILVAWFINLTGGLDNWLNDYSNTYLSGRKGYGFLNVVAITVGNITVFLLGVKTYQTKNKFAVIFWSLIIIFALSFIGGIKGRFIFLLILFLSPWLISMSLTVKRVGLFCALFFCLLYIGTLIRTEGFYASPAIFMEMLISYFNSYQLHHNVVISRDPDFFQTTMQIFIKPLQLLGLADADSDFDISVMLTKEFFPEQWYDEFATQQWPLDTELYLNYYGPWFSWAPLLIYAAFISWLYRLSVLRLHLTLLPIYVMEFYRLFSMMRGTLIPWDMPIFITQYILIYLFCRSALRARHLSTNPVFHKCDVKV